MNIVTSTWTDIIQQFFPIFTAPGAEIFSSLITGFICQLEQKRHGRVREIAYLATNLQYGCTILKFYLDKEKGNLRRALARYNGSLGKRKYPNKVLERLRTKWFRI